MHRHPRRAKLRLVRPKGKEARPGGGADLEFHSLEKQRSVNTGCWHGGWEAVILQDQPVPAPRSYDPTCEERFLLAGLMHIHTYSMIEFQLC